MKKIAILLSCAVVLVASGCNNRTRTKIKKTDEGTVVETKDSHGCLVSNGEMWSSMLDRCVRPADEGKRLYAIKDADKNSPAYIIFNADSVKAELFTPDGTTTLYRVKHNNGTSFTWNSIDLSPMVMSYVDGKLVVMKDNQEMFSQAEPAAPLKTVYNGTDGRTKMNHVVVFNYYPTSDTASLTYGDETYYLKPYVVGSGFGYRNDKVDIRGKGEEATLTFADKSKPELKLRVESRNFQ